MRILKSIKIEKIGYGGIGLARMPDGKRILIKWGALPGNVVDLKIVKQKKDYIEAHILEVKSYDPNIVDGTIFCPHFFSVLGRQELSEEEKTRIGCGGCKRQLLSYPRQLELKQSIVEESFTKLKKHHGDITVASIIGSPQEKWYRNKIEFSFGKYIVKDFTPTGDDKADKAALRKAPITTLSDWSLWFHKQGEFSKIINIESCGLISEKANNLFAHIKELLLASWLPVFDQKTHLGFFRHLVMREWVNTGQVLINLVVADQHLVSDKTKQQRDTLLETLKSDNIIKEQITTWVITYNNGLADITHTPDSETKIFFGEGQIYDQLRFAEDNWEIEITPETARDIHVNFRISPFSFFQTNTLWAQTLFQQAAHMVGAVQWTILDLYCGTWSIWLSFLKMWKWEDVVGIEIVEEAIIDAWHNAKINGVDQKVFFAATPAEKAFTTVPEIMQKLENLWLVVVDPPRDWLHKNVISTLSELRKSHSFKLLYISCNPITMARDIELLIQEWFQIKTLQPVDMFPQTHHIEVIGVLS